MFRRRRKPNQDGFYNTGLTTRDLADGQMKKITVNGRNVTLAVVAGQLFAFEDSCPHGAASLARGLLNRNTVCCVEHGYCFDLHTGALVHPAGEPYQLRCFLLEDHEGRLELRLDA